MATPAVTPVLLPGMDGSGELFADFIAALGDAVVPVVVPYSSDGANPGRSGSQAFPCFPCSSSLVTGGASMAAPAA